MCLTAGSRPRADSFRTDAPTQDKPRHQQKIECWCAHQASYLLGLQSRGGGGVCLGGESPKPNPRNSRFRFPLPRAGHLGLARDNRTTLARGSKNKRTVADAWLSSVAKSRSPAGVIWRAKSSQVTPTYEVCNGIAGVVARASRFREICIVSLAELGLKPERGRAKHERYARCAAPRKDKGKVATICADPTLPSLAYPPWLT